MMQNPQPSSLDEGFFYSAVHVRARGRGICTTELGGVFGDVEDIVMG